MTGLKLPHCTFGIAAAMLMSLVISGCATDDLASQYRDDSNKGYIAGDGSVTEIPPDERAEVIEFGGKTENGLTFSSTELEGRMAVLNF